MKKNLLVSLSCVVLLNAPAAIAETEKEVVLGYVNDSTITREEYDEYVKLRTRHSQTPSPEIVMEELVSRELLFQQAVAQKLEQTPKAISMMEAFRYNLLAEQMHDAHLKTLNFSEEQLKAEYDRIIKENERPTEYLASHILFDNEKAAVDTLEILNKGEDFAELAKKNSKDPGSAPKGGDLGWFEARQMVKPFSDALQAMKKDEIKGPIKTRFGWHIIQLKDSRKVAAPAFEAVKEQVEKRLQGKAMLQYVNGLKEKATVKTTEAFAALQVKEKPEAKAEDKAEK